MEKPTQQNSSLVMIIDDTKQDLFVNKLILEVFVRNHEIIPFNLGTLAMEYLETNQNDISKIPTTIFLDIHMPQMSAFEFLDEFDKLAPPVK